MTETVREHVLYFEDLAAPRAVFDASDPILDAIIYNTCPTCGGERQVLTTNRDNLIETPESDNLVILQDPCPDCADNTHILSADLREKAAEAVMRGGWTWAEVDEELREACRETVDAVLSTVFGHVRVAKERRQPVAMLLSAWMDAIRAFDSGATTATPPSPLEIADRAIAILDKEAGE